MKFLGLLGSGAVFVVAPVWFLLGPTSGMGALGVVVVVALLSATRAKAPGGHDGVTSETAAIVLGNTLDEIQRLLPSLEVEWRR